MQVQLHKVGDVCMALWKPTGRWYAAKITGIKSKCVLVQFLEDDIVCDLKHHQIKVGLNPVVRIAKH